MARNNSDRLGEIKKPEHAETPPVTPQSGLTFVTPTEFVDLPSRGVYYPDGHPLKGEEVVELRFMTAKEEDMLTSPALLKKGLAIDRVLQSLIVDQRIKVADMLLGDKSAMIMAARISGYGADYMATVTCPACATKTKHFFDLNLAEIYHPEEEKLQEWKVTDKKDGTFECELPRSKVVLRLRLLTGKDERYLHQMTQKKKKHNLPEAPTTDILKRIIVSANGETDPIALNKFVENMPAFDSRYLRNALRVLTPTVSNKQEFMCTACGYDQDLEVPFGTEFFWPEQ
tara:strand:+ start:263 stop:1120 length:858 start_codon:yes stop_codon:yes gene_type:complete